ncbi:MAG: hypothetical protein UR60_C0008G0013 [Candidatus Moranbacteria bacterium GW2011_GWF2_34_56]|nr:MAG: hypothetical protein UR60_C0008G0013 [Candidatus Moranbacteria bacterium GW2011_GWF2_34_56]
MSSDEELKLRIEKLREARALDENKMTENEKEEIERKLRDYGNYMKSMRTTYLQKEYEFNKTSSAMKRFFKMDKVDMGNAEKELENSKKDYLEAVENYLNVMVILEKPADKEEREIIYRYAHFGEALQVMSAKENIKLEKNPKLESFKRSFGAGTASFLDKYKELLGKPKELIAKKTGSKVLGFSGGIAAVGGAMALAANYIPGLRNVTLPLGIAVATKCFYEKAENEAVIEKEKSIEEGVELLEKRLAYIDELGAEVDEAFKKELGLAVENITEEVAKEKKAVGKRMVVSLAKAIAVSSTFYMAGQLVREFFGPDELKNNIFENKNSLKPDTISSHHGSSVHSSPNIPPSHLQEAEAMPSHVQKIINNEGEIFETLNNIKKIHTPQNVEQPAMMMSDSQEHEVRADFEEDKSDSSGTLEQAGNNTGAEEKNSPTGNQEIHVGSSAEYNGIVLNESGEGNIYVQEGSSMKDTVAKLLIQNHEKLTEGKMGWDPVKYSSVEEWADKRAIGIVGEFTGGSHDFDKISIDSKIDINLSNPADIRIVDFTDGQKVDLPVNSEGASGLGNQENATVPEDEGDEFENDERESAGSENQDNAETPEDEGSIFEDDNRGSVENTQGNKVVPPGIKESAVFAKENITGDITEKDILPQDAAEKDMEEVRKNMGKQEALAAKRIGIDPEHYAKINQMSTAEFIAEAKRVDSVVHGGGEDSMDVVSSNLPVGNAFSDDEMANTKMGRILNYLLRDGKIENPNQSIAETLRTVSQQDLMGSIRTYEGIFGNIDDTEGIAMNLNEDEVYSQYMASLIQAELKDMLSSTADEGKVMRELAALRGVSMRDLANNELLLAFKEATKDVVGDVEYRDNDTLGKYIVRTIRAAHDEGAIGKLRDSLAKIEVAA